jgi:ABC-2 type transport system permease protein
LGQIVATLDKTIKEFLRQKTVLFWTIAWPIMWVLIGSFSFTGNAPDNVVPYIKGSITISMITFALMTAGIANLPGNIAEDRGRGLLSKLMSMPISPWRDFVGRILALLSFSSLAAVLVALVGYVCEARFSYTIIGFLQSIGFFLLTIFASAGIGMLIATFIKHVHGAIMTGVGIAVVTASISGVMAPYSSLPSVLQHFARVYPVSSANSSITYLLVGEGYAGYNPLSAGQTTLTIVISFILLIACLITYSRFCWRKK